MHLLKMKMSFISVMKADMTALYFCSDVDNLKME